MLRPRGRWRVADPEVVLLPSVSVVIPTKNGGPQFRRVLERLRSQTYGGTIEIVAIDSGSTDDTIAAAREHGARVESIPPAEFDHGLTRNRGIETSSGDVIVLLSQDAEPADDSLVRRLVAAFDDPRVGGAYARQIPRDDADVLTKRNLNGWVTGRLEPEVRTFDVLAYERMTSWDKYLFCTFDNVCSAMRRAAWKEVPFRQYEIAEDNEWCLRAFRAGWKIAYVPDAAVIHSHDRSARYEYERTYMCHRKLYELFALQCVPTLSHALRSTVRGTLADWRYVLAHEPAIGRKLRLLASVPARSAASAFGQWRGARDEKLGRGKRIRRV
jgi:glycosyltransferase involved in cell wall biosynthesis